MNNGKTPVRDTMRGTGTPGGKGCAEALAAGLMNIVRLRMSTVCTPQTERLPAARGTFPAILIPVVFVLLLLAGAHPLRAERGDGTQGVLRVGFSSKVFPDVDQRDARVAMELWTRELARALGFRCRAETRIYNNLPDLIEAVRKGELAIVTLPATEFLQVRDRTPMHPIIVAAANAGTARQYVLIVRRDNGFETIVDLRGKSILIPTANKYEASHLWLHVLLLRETGNERNRFFGKVRECNSASQSIMAVFFGKADAAIVRRGALDAGTVLNPQLGTKLKVIAESKPLHGDITCVPDMVPERLKKSIENAALHLHDTTSGRQIFTLFQIDRVIPYNPSYLSGLIELLDEQKKLTAKSARRP